MKKVMFVVGTGFIVLDRAIFLGIPAVVGVGIYFAVTAIVGIAEMRELANKFSRLLRKKSD